MNQLLGSLSLKEIEIIAELPRFPSLRALSRSRNIEAAQITRALQRIEGILDANILERTHAGIKLTEEGERLAAVASRIVESAAELFESKSSALHQKVLTLGTRGFLNFVFGPKLTAVKTENSGDGLNSHQQICLRFLDMSPEELKVAEHKRLIQLAIHLGEMEWTQSWESYYAGKLVWSAFVRPGHPLEKKNSKGTLEISDFNDFEFVAPCYWVGTEIKNGEDGFPIPLSRRKVSAFAQSAMTAIEIARSTNNIVFAPNIVSMQQVEAGFLTRLNAGGTENCFQEVYLSVRTDAISKKLKDLFLEKMREVLV